MSEAQKIEARRVASCIASARKQIRSLPWPLRTKEAMLVATISVADELSVQFQIDNPLFDAEWFYRLCE